MEYNQLWLSVDVLKAASDLMKYCNEEGKPKYQWKSIFNIIVYDERNRSDRIDFVVNLLMTSGERFISIRQLDASGIYSLEAPEYMLIVIF